MATAQIIAAVQPDVLVLTEFDYDHDGLALAAFAGLLATQGVTFAHLFALSPNSGMATGLDLDQDGRTGDARDAQGYGRFAGNAGMAILSRWPIRDADVRDLSGVLWRDMPGATLPRLADGAPWPSEVLAAQRLSTTGHWLVPVDVPEGPALTLLAFSATPPVFDGPEDRNGLRNRDELMLWSLVLDGAFGPPPKRFVVIGNANLDPVDGDGLTFAMAAFLTDPRMVDPVPRSLGGSAAADLGQNGDPGLDTADWPDGAPGNLRVSYVLPDANWVIQDSGVFWPAPDDPAAKLLGPDGQAAGPHRLVWVDIVGQP